MAIAAAHAKAVALYFLLRNRLGTETVSWVCVLGAAPFAAMGFFRYHGMIFEKFLWVFLRSELLEPRVYLFKPRNHFAEITKEYRREQTRSQRKQKARVRLRKLHYVFDTGSSGIMARLVFGAWRARSSLRKSTFQSVS